MVRFEVRWKNFRGFEDTGWLPIRPITILIGANNTGKSSLIAPLLLLRQTVDSRSADPALITRGELVNVGTFRDFIFRHETDREVSFSLRWHSHAPSGDEKPVGTYSPGELRVHFAHAGEDVVLSKYEVFDIYRRRYLTRALMNNGRYSLRDLKVRPSAKAPRGVKVSDRAARLEMPVNFLFRGNAVFEAQAEFRARSHTSGNEESPAPPLELSEFARVYWQVTSFTYQAMTDLVWSTSYLGPIREPLRRVYELRGDPPVDVGTRGQYAPEILFRNATLLDETRRWLRHFGLGRSLRTTSSRDGAFSLYFPAGGGRPSVNLADVGFGASQILPMIVQGLSAYDDSLLVMEQPEIHLNPRLQSRIADFLVHMANANKGVLVETHSEHLLLRLRRLIAEEQLGEDDVALYFVDRSEGSSTIRAIPISNGGFIKPTDWPKGFFQESVREAFALADAQNRRRRDAG